MIKLYYMRGKFVKHLCKSFPDIHVTMLIIYCLHILKNITCTLLFLFLIKPNLYRNDNLYFLIISTTGTLHLICALCNY